MIDVVSESCDPESAASGSNATIDTATVEREIAMLKSKAVEPISGSKGATDPGPRNLELDRQNPDILTPPETDNGALPNLKFSFGMAHNRLEEGGWAREVTVRDLPVAKSMAGVNMRLDPGRCPGTALAQGGRVGLHS